MNCRICDSSETGLWKTDTYGKEYLFCSRCGFIQVLKEYFPDPHKERQRYLEHNNSPKNTGYIKYLTDFLKTGFVPYVRKGGRVLDFGSGPVPVLSELLVSEGYITISYDPYFSNNTEWKKGKFDGVAAVEVFEHLQNPLKEISEISAVLEKGGYLVIRTMLHTEDRSFFSRWWYRNDFTHISFYSVKTFETIAEMFALEFVSQINGSMIILRKPS